MKRLLLTTVTALSLAVVAPGSALASGPRDHGRDHARGHARDHARLHRDHRDRADRRDRDRAERRDRDHQVRRARHAVRIGSETPGVAGRITSHTGNRVEVALLDGSTLTGTITDATKIVCIRHVDGRLALAHCMAGDLKPGRRIADGLLEVTPRGSFWRLIVVWD